ncbi:Uncharacterised protein [Mycobacteroides abscessus subsp. abscessus]|nr:Uncharacterised protein [Mycobacteroides abscessus subsp. abscessus]
MYLAGRKRCGGRYTTRQTSAMMMNPAITSQDSLLAAVSAPSRATADTVPSSTILISQAHSGVE